MDPPARPLPVPTRYSARASWDKRGTRKVLWGLDKGVACLSPAQGAVWGLPVPRLSPQHLWSHARAMRLWRASHARDGAGQFAQRLRLDEYGNQPIGAGQFAQRLRLDEDGNQPIGSL